MSSQAGLQKNSVWGLVLGSFLFMLLGSMAGNQSLAAIISGGEAEYTCRRPRPKAGFSEMGFLHISFNAWILYHT